MLSSLHYLQGKAADSLVAACSDSAADVMAIAEVGGDRVTITRSDMSVKEVKVPDDADHCSSLALSADGSVLFVGTEGGHLLMSDLKAGSFTMLTLPLTSGTGPATISIDCIARNNDEDIFAVAAAG